MNKKVSVIIPTYKRSNFLERAVESVLCQTYKNIEIIVVDDNNPDSTHRIRTENIMMTYKDNNRVKYIKNKKNMGGALARNEGVFSSEGDYITFLDDDDIYLPEKIDVQLKYMLENKKDMCFTNVRIHNSNNILIDYREHKYIQSESNVDLLRYHIMHHLTPTATYMFKKTELVKIGGFDDVEVGQEFILMLKAIEAGLNIGYLPVANVIQYLHDGKRISVGENKIEKERELFYLKKKYFWNLSTKQQNYVKFRHHAVIAVVAKRSNKEILMLKHLLLAFITSPTSFISEIINHIKKLTKYKHQY